MNINIPDSPINLLMQQPPDIQLNALLENYLTHHADSPVRTTVERAIASPNAIFKMQVLATVAAYG